MLKSERYRPDYWFERVTDIPIEFLQNKGISWLAVDMDNTLTLPNTVRCSEDVKAWLTKVRESGINLILVSNNKRKRVKPVAKVLEMPYVFRALKPWGFGISFAALRLNRKKKDGAFIGDQLFTDISAAKRAKVIAILVDPLVCEQEGYVGFKRKFEAKYHASNMIVKQTTAKIIEELNVSEMKLQ